MPATKIARAQVATSRKNSRRPAKAKKASAKKPPREVHRQYTAEELWDEEETRFFQPYFDRLTAKKA